MAASQALVPVPVQTVVPVPNNVVISQTQPYPNSEMEELTPIPIPLPPQQEETAQPPVKKGRESTGKWKGYDSKRVFKKEWEDRYGKCNGLLLARSMSFRHGLSLWRPLGPQGDAQDANL